MFNRKEYQRQYFLKNKEKIYAKAKESIKNKSPEIKAKYNKIWNENNKRWRRKVRKEVILKYGNKCNCCGEKTYEFLTIDHVDNNGSAHRKEVRGAQLPIWIRKNNYPKTLQVLCYNCNCAKAFHEFCPHQKLKPSQLDL